MHDERLNPGSRAPLVDLTTRLEELPGIGSERSAQLARLGLFTVRDLLWHCPRRYEDRRRIRAIAELQMREPSIARGKVAALGIKRYHHGTKSVFELILEDGTARLHCRWWNMPFMERHFQV
ncbi:MAG: ATP-dependent DNA helicase RecG, partial [Candidatus Omnitrophica bacterium]|nr:ATP-dependent DNA helicase RecG [Candidatus Omnitrophota bacterium]